MGNGISISNESEVDTPKTGKVDSAGYLTMVEDMLRKHDADMHERIGQAAERAFGYADKYARELRMTAMAEMEKLNAAMSTLNTPKVMTVNIDGHKNKLTHAAVSYLPRLLVNAKLGLNTMLVGPTGCGKTTAAEQLAQALGLEFGHLNLTAGASETWLFGRQTPTGFIEGDFSRLYGNGGVFLADEMDAADANLLLSINTAIGSDVLSNPINGQKIKRHPNFVFIAACNTFGRGADSVYTGRSRLDAATLRRFVRLEVGYCETIEAAICPDTKLRTLLQNARKKLIEIRSPEVISTACLRCAFLQAQAGVTMTEILTSLVLGWPEEIVKQCGLTPSKPSWAKESSDDVAAELERAKAENERLKSLKNKSADLF